MERARSIIRDAVVVLDAIPSDVGLPTTNGYAAAGAPSTPRPTPGTDAQQEEANISASAPPVSTTKGGRKRVGAESEDAPEPHFQRQKQKQRRRCKRCGLYDTGHNAATCARIQMERARGGVTKRPRGRPRGTGRGRGSTRSAGGDDRDEVVFDVPPRSSRRMDSGMHAGRGGGRVGANARDAEHSEESECNSDEYDDDYLYDD